MNSITHPQQPSESSAQSAEGLNSLLQRAEEADAGGAPHTAIPLYTQYIMQAGNSPNDLKHKETAILRVAAILSAGLSSPNETSQRMIEFIRALESQWLSFPRAKAAKIIKTLLDAVDPVAAGSFLPQLLSELLEWCVRDRRFYLKQTLQLRLAAVHFAQGRVTEALGLLSELAKELRRLDDKLSLVEVHLLESRILESVRAVAKARASLTAARTAANAVYCPPLLMAELDLQAGLLHLETDGMPSTGMTGKQEHIYGTAMSYFIEAMDGYSVAAEGGQPHPDGHQPLVMIILCKVLLDATLDAIDAYLEGSKSAKLYRSACEPQVSAFKQLASAFKERSLASFDAVLKEYSGVFEASGQLVFNLVESLYEGLLEENILKAIAPYSRLSIQSLSEQLKLDPSNVEQKLAMMILDKRFFGVIDHSPAGGYLLISEEPREDPVYSAALKVVASLEGVVEALYNKARALQ